VTCTKDARNKASPWVVRWREVDVDGGGRAVGCRSFARKVERNRFAAELRAEVIQPQRLRRLDEVTLRSFLDDFLRTKSEQIRPGAMGPYQETAKRLLDHFGSALPLAELTPRRAAAFIGQLQRRDGRPGRYSAASKEQRLRNCKTAFTLAVDWELLAKNPFARVKAPKAEARPWHHLTAEEYARLLAAAPDLRRKVIYALAYTGGLRFGEVFNLTWRAIDAEKAQVRIAHRPATAALPPFLVKDHEKRIVSLPQHTLGLIEDLGTYRSAVDDESPFLAIEGKRLARVCVKWQAHRAAGQPWKNQDMANNINRDLRCHMSRAGVIVPETEAFSFHTLRKSCIQNWADARLPMHVVRELAGHESITTTQRYYLRTAKADLDRAAAISQELIAGALLERAG